MGTLSRAGLAAGLVALLLLGVSSLASAGPEEALFPPTHTAGDWWLIKSTTEFGNVPLTFEMNMTLVSVEKDSSLGSQHLKLVYQSTTQMQGLPPMVIDQTVWLDAKTMAMVRQETTGPSGSKQIMEIEDPRDAFRYPVSVGDEWAGREVITQTTIDPSGRETTNTTEVEYALKVIAREDVHVKAGYMESLRVEVIVDGNVTEYWFAPAANINALLTQETVTPFGISTMRMELLDYHVANPGEFKDASGGGGKTNPGKDAGGGKDKGGGSGSKGASDDAPRKVILSEGGHYPLLIATAAGGGVLAAGLAVELPKLRRGQR